MGIHVTYKVLTNIKLVLNYTTYRQKQNKRRSIRPRIHLIGNVADQQMTCLEVGPSRSLKWLWGHSKYSTVKLPLIAPEVLESDRVTSFDISSIYHSLYTIMSIGVAIIGSGTYFYTLYAVCIG